MCVCVSAKTWCQVVEKALAEAPRGKESRDVFLKRLSNIAKGLSRAYIQKALAQMKHRIKAVVDADGFVPKLD